ncbi:MULTISPECIES: hypothetical protein [Streptomyces]|uniref:Uncharacterized protein n=2 Tax=Streptomyces TaxID=1883 RepID=A0A646KK44_STRJU|nr:MULTISPECIES: hypothetical protein [Streptomyces]MQS39892.1 hypothetical protein [Streptomyces katsurahamanus]MQT02387.1 hypothetical protein [Streptomyces jumonjinensis]
MKRRVRSAVLAVSVATGVALALSGGTAHAQEQETRSGGLINITGPLFVNTGDIDLIEDVFEHISIPILGQAVHQMYDWARFDGVLTR